jgi:UDP-N-acetylglucosamine 2-epimerase
MSIKKIELRELPEKQDVCPYGNGNSAHKIVEILKSQMMSIKCKIV